MSPHQLKQNIKFWESKRILFNAIIFLVGLYAIFATYSQFDYDWSWYDTLAIILWEILVNVFYSFGFLLEIIYWYYFDKEFKSKGFRIFLFISGLIFSCVLTYFYPLFVIFSSETFDLFQMFLFEFF